MYVECRNSQFCISSVQNSAITHQKCLRIYSVRQFADLQGNLDLSDLSVVW